MTRTSTMSALRASAVADWELCGDCFYSREQLYDLVAEECDFKNNRVCCASYGGPFAMVRDESKTVILTSSSSMRPIIRTFTAAGVLLAAVVWDKGRILDWGWTINLELVVLEDSMQVTVFSMHGEKLREFTLGSPIQKEGIKQVAMTGEGMVVLTGCNRLWMVADVRSPRVSPMADIVGVVATSPEAAASCCIAALNPRFSLTGNVEALLAIGPTIWQVDDETATAHLVLATAPKASSSKGAAPADTKPSAIGPCITSMVLSPDSQFVALYTDDGRLIVMDADLTKKLSEFETKSDSAPKSIAWCGSDAVLMLWPELLILIGPFGDHISWPVDVGECPSLVSEIDGVRILSTGRHELLRKIPACLVDIYRPGSTAPASQLWDARDLYDAHIARSDKVLRGIMGDKGGLAGAVASCIQAAGLESNISRQKALLRAACYGRAYCSQRDGRAGDSSADDESPPSAAMHATTCKLRVLNAIRETTVGLPLTMLQLDALTMPVVVSRLVAYHQWLLAYRVAGALRPSNMSEVVVAATGAAEGGLSPPSSAQTAAISAAPSASSMLTSAMGPTTAALAAQEQVLSQWACAKISAHAHARSGTISDHDLKEQLMVKLRECHNIRFAPLAAHAQSVGRRQLAIKLLEEESSCALQVPLLLSLSVSSRKSYKVGGGSQAEEELLPAGPGLEAEDTLSRALRKAIESGDTDLVYLVLFHIYQHRALPDFLSLISSRSLARNLFFKYCRVEEPELLETILVTSGGAQGLGTPELAELQFRRALSTWESSQRVGSGGENALLRLAASLGDVSHKFGTSRDYTFQSKAVSEMSLLRKEQARLEKETGQQLFVGLSLMGTLQACIKHGHHKQSASLKKLFSVSEKRFCWLKVRTLASIRDWEGLDAFSAETSGRKVPVIGWEPFLEAAKKHSAPREILIRLISRFPDSSLKAEEFNAINCQREAAEVAAKLRDGDLFARIAQSVNTNSPAGLAIAQIRERFQATFR